MNRQKNMARALAGAALLALLSLPSTGAAKLVSGIAAVVNDEIITTVEVDRELGQMLKEAERAPGAALGATRGAAVNRLVDKKLIEQKIRELDIRISDEEVKLAIEDVKKQNNLDQEGLERALGGQGMTFAQYRAQLKEQLERLRLMSQEVRSKVQVGEREIREYYEANLASYGGSETFRARHIFFRVEKKGGAEELAKTEAKANEVLAKARAGVDFAELAKKYSQDPAAAKDGGDLGSFKRADMLPEIGNTVAAMKPGDISPLVLSPAGLHIIKLEDKSQGEGKPFEQVRDAIEDLLYKKKSDERFAQWVKDLRAAASIEIKEQ